jgi:hypothetical protein
MSDPTSNETEFEKESNQCIDCCCFPTSRIGLRSSKHERQSHELDPEKNTLQSTERSSIEMNMDSTSDQILWMLSQLSEDEVETAARTSYVYLKHPKPAERDDYAKLMCQRYLESKRGDEQLALEKMISTIKFRQSMEIEELVTAFDKDNRDKNDDPAYEDESDVAQQLESSLESKHMYVCGFDKGGRSTFVFLTRRVASHDPEWSLKEALYTIERAIASSKAEDGSISAIVDLKDFSLKQAPPLDIGKQFLTTLRNHYAGHVKQIFIVDAPTSFRWLWNVLKGFVGTSTRDKIHFVSREEQELEKFYDSDQIAINDDARELDLTEYFYETPFDKQYRLKAS